MTTPNRLSDERMDDAVHDPLDIIAKICEEQPHDALEQIAIALGYPAVSASTPAPTPDDERKAFEAWVADCGCDTDGAWSAWMGRATRGTPAREPVAWRVNLSADDWVYFEERPNWHYENGFTVEALSVSDSEWKAAVLDALASLCLDTLPGESPRDVLKRLIEVEVEIALDPAVSERARALQADSALRAAAQAILDRWNSPNWEWGNSTADLMADLRRVLDAGSAGGVTQP
jgi:hypothetical protein